MQLLRITASTNAIVVNDYTKLKSVILTAGADAATATLYDEETQTGTALLVVKAPANTTVEVPLCGLPLRKGLSVTTGGTSPLVYFLVE